ncbi:MAG: hypothetical protein GWP56_19125 [Gammaproteobacteria bacterium]|nr:hypothetical protein [Gammaproteobacteria bacterium]
MRVNSAFAILLLVLANAVDAREPGHYVPGIANIRDFAVPPDPGFYYVQYNAFYSTDTYRDRNGDSVDSIGVGARTIDLETDIDIYVINPQFMWVTDREIWGGRYSFYVAPSIGKASIGAGASAINRDIEFDDDNNGLGDTLLQPLLLGWSGAQHDLSLGFGLYLPTGEYDAGDSDNIGLGFWTAQLQFGGYYYLDETQASALMVVLTWETHGEKEDTNITPGDHATAVFSPAATRGGRRQRRAGRFRRTGNQWPGAADRLLGDAEP